MRKVCLIAQKDLKLIIRDPMALILYLLAPCVKSTINGIENGRCHHHVDDEKMASPERDIPCCAGTGPRSLRKDGYAGKVIVGKGPDSYEVHHVSLRSE